MKKSLFTIVVVFIFFSNSSISQDTYSVNTNSNATNLRIEKPKLSIDRIQGGIPCNPNTFWAHNGAGTLIEYSISGSTISPTGITYPIFSSCNAAIYADNSSGTTSFSPTFYSFDSNTMTMFDGSGWPVVFTEPNINGWNGCGSGDHIYFGGSGSSPGPFTRIYHYSAATGIDTVYIVPAGRVIAGADYAADDNGNCYFFTGTNGYWADSLMVVNPSGTVLNAYPLSLIVNNGYGAFLMGGIFYLGVGSAHPVSPLSLIPITITPTSAVIGTPISFPASIDYVDLESCNQGSPLGVMEHNATQSEITVSPNPASEYAELTFTPGLIVGECELTVVNLSGQEVQKYEITPAMNKIRIAVGNLKPGVYFISIQDYEEVYSAKLIVE